MQTAMAPPLLPLLLRALSFSFLFSVFYAYSTDIDCGTTSTTSYTDANSIVWIGEDDFNLGGVTRKVAPANSNSVVMDSMRVFTTGKRNCYDVEASSGAKLLVRASFFYGNYDGLSSPPSFLLTLDGNSWETVETTLNTLVDHEAVWVVKGDRVSVCLCQTNSAQFPFISALQIQVLDSGMYPEVTDSFTLFTHLRYSYGINTTVSYDEYDRIWSPANMGTGWLVAVNDFSYSVSVDVADNPPSEVLGNAVTTPSVLTRIQLATIPAAQSVYINFYFTEVTELDSTDRRWFRIFENNESWSDPISPPYGSALEMSIVNYNLTSDTTISIVATANSTLPPLISAMEIFHVKAGLNAQTNNNDVTGLIELGKSFTRLAGWGGDPCLPSPYSWEWINCTSDETPRVTELNLSGFKLSGELPDFSMMTALQVIDLSNNALSGGILDFLGTLPNLKQLNLANNQFSGPIPASISNNKNIKLTVTGNPDLCASGSSCETFDATPSTPVGTTPSTPVGTTPSTFVGTSEKKNNTGKIVGAIVPIFVFFWVIVGGLVIRNKRKAAAMAATGGAAPVVVGGVVGQKSNGNANRQPEGSPTYLLGKQIGNVAFDEIRDNNNNNNKEDNTQQGDAHNNHNNV